MKLISLFISIFFSSTILANTIINDSIQLNELTVTGTKTELSRKIIPLSVSKINQNEIEQTGQHNILPTLNTYIPGIFVTERGILGFGVAKGGSGAITMRGISSAPNTGVLLLIDGHPQYQGIFGHPLPDAYVASDVQSVEVVRGPASLLYGTNAMAGVVNLITKKQKQDGFNASFGGSYGSYNTQKYYGTAGLKYKKASLLLSANHDRTDGIRENSDFKITNAYAKAAYELNQHIQVNADYNIAKINANDNGPITSVPSLFNIDITRAKAAVSIENKYEKFDGALKVYHNYGEHKLTGGFVSNDRNSGIMLYQTLRLFKNNSITLGTDFKQYGGKVNMPPTIANKWLTANELAFYSYTQQQLFEKLTLSAGLRYENSTVFGAELIPMGGLSYILSENTSFKASVSKGFRSPTINELYITSNFPPTQPNPDLQPERMINYELSWLQSLLNNKLSFELTTFWVKGKNMIQALPPFPSKRQNVGTFDNKGIEFSAKYNVAKGFMLHANYNYLLLEKAVLAAPRQQANLMANYQFKKWNFSISTQYIEKLYTQIATLVLPNVTQTYCLINSRVSYRPINKLELFATGNNLLNDSYQINYGYPMPGINFNAGFNFKI